MMRHTAILLATVAALMISAGCDRQNVEDDREFDSDVDGLGSRGGGVSIPPALGANQTVLAGIERTRINANKKATAPPPPDVLDNTGLKPVTTAPAGGLKPVAGGTETGTGTPAGGTTETGSGGTETGTDKGTGSGSALDDIIGGDGT